MSFEAVHLPKGTVAHAQDSRVEYSRPVTDEMHGPSQQWGGNLDSMSKDAVPDGLSQSMDTTPAHTAQKPYDKK